MPRVAWLSGDGHSTASTGYSRDGQAGSDLSYRVKSRRMWRSPGWGGLLAVLMCSSDGEAGLMSAFRCPR